MIPDIYLDPRFSNDPGTGDPVLSTLFGWEAGGVMVQSGWEVP